MCVAPAVREFVATRLGLRKRGSSKFIKSRFLNEPVLHEVSGHQSFVPVSLGNYYNMLTHSTITP